MSMKRPNCLKCPTWQNKIPKDTLLCPSPPSTNQTNQFVISWPKFLNLPHEIRCFIWWVPLIITCGIRSLVESDALILNSVPKWFQKPDVIIFLFLKRDWFFMVLFQEIHFYRIEKKSCFSKSSEPIVTHFATYLLMLLCI